MKIEENAVYTTKEVAELLRISLPTVKRMLKDKRLPSARIGRQHRFLGKDLLKMVQVFEDGEEMPPLKNSAPIAAAPAKPKAEAPERRQAPASAAQKAAPIHREQTLAQSPAPLAQQQPAHAPAPQTAAPAEARPSPPRQAAPPPQPAYVPPQPAPWPPAQAVEQTVQSAPPPSVEPVQPAAATAPPAAAAPPAEPTVAQAAPAPPAQAPAGLTSMELRQRSYMLGKLVVCDIKDASGAVIIPANRPVDDGIILIAKTNKKMMELFKNLKHDPNQFGALGKNEDEEQRP